MKVLITFAHTIKQKEENIEEYFLPNSVFIGLTKIQQRVNVKKFNSQTTISTLKTERRLL